MLVTSGEPRRRLLLLAFPLLLVLGLAGALAFQALSAERARRSAVEHTLADYADFAAFIIASNARQELERRLLYAFGPVRAHVPAAGVPLPPPSVLGRDRAESNRCVAAGVTAPSYLRVDLPGKTVTAEGTPLPGSAVAWLADTLTAVARSTAARDWLINQMFAEDRGAGIVAYSVLRDSLGAPLAVYAKTSCLQIGPQSVFAVAMDRTPVLPPTLTGGLPNDSLVSMRVTDPHGHLLYASANQYSTRVTGEESSTAQWGAMRLAVGIRSDIADRLVAGGVSYSRMPLAVLLLLLIVLFAGLAFVQIRRQQEMMHLRESFISSVSHELRTPLQQILVFSELLRMDKLPAEERQQAIEVVEREARRLVRMVENVLRFSRATRGKDSLTIESVLLEPLVQDVIKVFEPRARSHGMTIKLLVEQPVVALADDNALRGVLLNLLDNAMKYGPAGQTVSVELSTRDHTAILAVEDEGPGVPRAQRPQVWEPFQRLERDQRAAIAGSGIGLTIVRELVERMNGTVRIEDAHGSSGARFVIELPSS